MTRSRSRKRRENNQIYYPSLFFPYHRTEEEKRIHGYMFIFSVIIGFALIAIFHTDPCEGIVFNKSDVPAFARRYMCEAIKMMEKLNTTNFT